MPVSSQRHRKNDTGIRSQDAWLPSALQVTDGKDPVLGTGDHSPTICAHSDCSDPLVSPMHLRLASPLRIPHAEAIGPGIYHGPPPIRAQIHHPTRRGEERVQLPSALRVPHRNNVAF